MNFGVIAKVWGTRLGLLSHHEVSSHQRQEVRPQQRAGGDVQKGVIASDLLEDGHCARVALWLLS